MKKVRDEMTVAVEALDAGLSVQDAARRMKVLDFGFFPVVEQGRLVGSLTDRDVTLRVLAEGRDPLRTRVRDVMTAAVAAVGLDDDLETAYAFMKVRQVRRLPVVDDRGRLAGLITLVRVARDQGEEVAGSILKEIVAPPSSPA